MDGAVGDRPVPSFARVRQRGFLHHGFLVGYGCAYSRRARRLIHKPCEGSGSCCLLCLIANNIPNDETIINDDKTAHDCLASINVRLAVCACGRPVENASSVRGVSKNSRHQSKCRQTSKSELFDTSVRTDFDKLKPMPSIENSDQRANDRRLPTCLPLSPPVPAFGRFRLPASGSNGFSHARTLTEANRKARRGHSFVKPTYLPPSPSSAPQSFACLTISLRRYSTTSSSSNPSNGQLHST